MRYIDEIKARLAAATPWPWIAKELGDAGLKIVLTDNSNLAVAQKLFPQDAEFVAHAPADIAALLRVADAAKLAQAAFYGGMKPLSDAIAKDALDAALTELDKENP